MTLFLSSVSAPLELKDALDIFFERSNAVQTFWNFYIGVTLGLLGFIAASTQAARMRVVKILLTCAFVGFAASNLNALVEVEIQCRATANLVSKLAVSSGEDAEIAKTVKSPNIPGIIAFHLTGDVFVLFGIWLIPYYKPDSFECSARAR